MVTSTTPRAWRRPAGAGAPETSSSAAAHSTASADQPPSGRSSASSSDAHADERRPAAGRRSTRTRVPRSMPTTSRTAGGRRTSNPGVDTGAAVRCDDAGPGPVPSVRSGHSDGHRTRRHRHDARRHSEQPARRSAASRGDGVGRPGGSASCTRWPGTRPRTARGSRAAADRGLGRARPRDALRPCSTGRDPDLVYVTYGKLWLPVFLGFFLCAFVVRPPATAAGVREVGLARGAGRLRLRCRSASSLEYWTQWTGEYERVLRHRFPRRSCRRSC